MQRQAIFGGARGQHLDLHPRHVDAGRTFAATGLARHAQFQRLGHFVGGEGIGTELTGDGQPQGVGPAARHVLFLARDAITRTHGPALQFAAGAIVVAHLDRALKTATGAGICGPVERGRHRLAVIARRIAQQGAVVELRRTHHLTRIEQIVRIEAILHLLERAHQFRTEHEFMKFGTDDAVAMFARVRAFVFLHHGERLLGDGAHGLDVLLLPQIEHRPHMQTAGAGMRVPGTARAVLLENPRQPRGVVRKVIERHRAVLDEGYRLPLVLHRHHDVEARGAHLGDRRLQRGVEHIDHAAPMLAGLVPAETEIAHHIMQTGKAADILLLIRLAELDQQDRFRRVAAVAAHELLQRRAEQRNVPRKLDHGAVDQLDTDRLQAHQMLRRRHRLVERAEVTGADRTAAEHRRQLQIDPVEKGERAFAAGENMREIGVIIARHQRIEIVAADAALHLGKARDDFFRLACADRQQVARQRLRFRRVGKLRQIRVDPPEPRMRAIRQPRLDAEHVVAHGAEPQRARAAGIVGRHAADGRARCGRDIDRKPQAMRLELAIEFVEHHARLDRAAARGDVEIDQLVEMARAIDDQRVVDGLSALRRAATARGDAHAVFSGDIDRPVGFFNRPRCDHTNRHDLIVRCIGGVAAAREIIKSSTIRQRRVELPFKNWSDHWHLPPSYDIDCIGAGRNGLLPKTKSAGNRLTTMYHS